MGKKKHKVAIIGLGLIGGSLGLALRGARLGEIEVVGYDKEPGVRAKARRLGAVDKEASSVEEAVQGAGLVVVATPITAIPEVLEAAAPYLREDVVVTDTASTKAMVMDWAKRLLPPSVNFVGGHPMAGKELQGIEHAEAGLFRERAYCICPDPDCDPTAVGVVMSMAQTVGARPVFLDPVEHDVYVAAVSHIPLLASVAVFRMAWQSQAWADMAPLASSGFRDVTRLASGDPHMSHDICLTNRQAILHWLERLQGEISHLRHLVADGGEELFKLFAIIQRERDNWLKQEITCRGGVDLQWPSFKDTLADFLLGRAVRERMQRLGEMLGQTLKERSAREEVLARLFVQRLEEDLRFRFEQKEGEGGK